MNIIFRYILYLLKNPDPELVRIAKETGGKVIRPSDIDSLRKIYNEVKTSEEYSYVLVYNTYKLPSFTGWWVDVKLEVKYKGQTVMSGEDTLYHNSDRMFNARRNMV